MASNSLPTAFSDYFGGNDLQQRTEQELEEERRRRRLGLSQMQMAVPGLTPGVRNFMGQMTGIGGLGGIGGR